MFENVIRTSLEPCYSDFWLSSDMENLAFIFEYCEKYVKEDFGKKICARKFINAFMRSVCRFQMELGHPRLITQAGQDTVDMFILNDCKGNLEPFLLEKNEEKEYFEPYSLYWCGEMYAYLHWYYKLKSYYLIDELFPLDTMLALYKTGHEISRENFIEKVDNKVKTWIKENPEKAKN